MAEDTLTGPRSTGIPELILVKVCLGYFPLLRWDGTIMLEGLGGMGGRIEDNLGCWGLCLRALFFPPLLFKI